MLKIKIENGIKVIAFELTEANSKVFIDELKECISNPQKKPFIMIKNAIMGSSFLSNSIITLGE